MDNKDIMSTLDKDSGFQDKDKKGKSGPVAGSLSHKIRDQLQGRPRNRFLQKAEIGSAGQIKRQDQAGVDRKKQCGDPAPFYAWTDASALQTENNVQCHGSVT